MLLVLTYALVDPNTSAEAKQHAREMLHGQSSDAAGIDHEDEVHEHRVLGGYKATLKSELF